MWLGMGRQLVIQYNVLAIKSPPPLGLRLMGIGRNQYIDLMNQSRSTKKFGGFLRQLKSGVGVGGGGRDLLPPRVVETVPILPWWVVQVGYVTEEDMKVRRDLISQERHIFCCCSCSS